LEKNINIKENYKLMSKFRCPDCSNSSEKTGTCPDCGIALEKVCPFCGEDHTRCTCDAARDQTKGGTKQ